MWKVYPGLLLCLALGVAAIWLGWRSLGVVRQLLGRRTSRIADVKPGAIEVAGIVAADKPVKDTDGRPCALIAIDLRHEWQVNEGKNTRTICHARSWIEQAHRITLDDGTGTCTLSLEKGVTVLAYQRRWSMDYHEFLRQFPREQDRLAEVKLGTVIRYERSIETGQRALASGVAWPNPEATPGGYRQGAGDSYLVGGDTEHTLLVVSRGQNTGALRAGLPGALMMLCGLLLLGFTGWYASIFRAILR
jgi:hypothetical protein